MQLRHVLEIHPVYAGDEAERHENGGDDGEHAHDGVEPIADARQIDIETSRDHFTQCFDRVDDLNDVVIDVPEKNLRRVLKEGTIRPGKRVHDVPERPDSTP